MNIRKVVRLRIYPIKGLDGTQVQEVCVLASGALSLDRRWALVDARGKFVNGKNRPEVHSIRAEYDLAQREVTLDGRAFSLSGGPSLSAWFSERLGEAVEWRENVDMGFPDDTESPGPTFVSSASIQRVGEWFGLSTDEVRRRFRCNVEFDGFEPFWEDRLYGSHFRVGEVGVEAVNPCQRCVVPSRDSLTGTQDAGFQKRFAELRKAEMPTFAKHALFTHHYRLTVNTRIAPTEAGKTLHVGDVMNFDATTPA